MKRYLSLLYTSLFILICSCATAKLDRKPSQEAKAPRPKYDKPTTPVPGPAATRLFDSHDYVRQNPAPDFWALMPYYIPQEKGTCAASSVAMILNALDAHKKLTSDDKLVTTKDLIAKVNDPLWIKSMQDEKCYDLDRLADVVRDALKKYGHDRAEVKVIHISDTSAQTRATVRHDLMANEKSDRNFIIANFLQGEFTGDPEGTGHVSPVAAYDALHHRVLVMDVDREYYEPYWVTENIFLAGMNTKDEGVDSYRGYMMIREK